VHWNWTLSL